jgi:hypothetical protein
MESRHTHTLGTQTSWNMYIKTLKTHAPMAGFVGFRPYYGYVSCCFRRTRGALLRPRRDPWHGSFLRAHVVLGHREVSQGACMLHGVYLRACTALATCKVFVHASRKILYVIMGSSPTQRDATLYACGLPLHVFTNACMQVECPGSIVFVGNPQ